MALIAFNLVKLLLFSTILLCGNYAQYQPNWDSLDNRPIPEWYDRAKIGIFLHWGVYAVPSLVSEWFWWYWKGETPHPDIVEFMKKNYEPNFTYQDFARQFTAEFFDAEQWVDLFQRSGAKYIVLTSKHHEGYTLWPSRYSFSWNSMDVGPHRDLVGELANATRAKQLHFGLYHSLFEWFNPMFLNDEANKWTTQIYVDNKAIPEMKELVANYQPEIVWSDGDWGADSTYWKSTEFLAWLYNDSPVRDFVVTNDRWGSDTSCKHGGFFSCADRFNPGHLMPRKWENAMTIDKRSWGYRRNAPLDDILTIEELLSTIVQTVSNGGNILINVGPTKEGTIIPIFQERLLQMGEWLAVNGEAIYETKPWTVQNDTATRDVWYTSKDDLVYAFFLTWPHDNTLALGSALKLFQNVTIPPAVIVLGNEGQFLSAVVRNDSVEIALPNKSIVTSQWVWCLKFLNHVHD